MDQSPFYAHMLTKQVAPVFGVVSKLCGCFMGVVAKPSAWLATVHHLSDLCGTKGEASPESSITSSSAALCSNIPLAAWLCLLSSSASQSSPVCDLADLLLHRTPAHQSLISHQSPQLTWPWTWLTVISHAKPRSVCNITCLYWTCSDSSNPDDQLLNPFLM